MFELILGECQHCRIRIRFLTFLLAGSVSGRTWTGSATRLHGTVGTGVVGRYRYRTLLYLLII